MNGRERMKRGIGIASAAAICLSLAGSAPAAAGTAEPCGAQVIRTASGCTSLAAAGRHVKEIVNRTVDEQGLRAALVRVDIGDRTLATASPGESMAGVPANLRMHFRIGSIAIPYLMDLVLQLQDQGRLSLDDPVSKWLPDVPNADRVTLRMLASATSGYPDWIQGNQDFIDTLLADVFRQWQTQELVNIAFGQPLICDPGECFHYAHTNYVILARVVHAITGRPVGKLLRKRILGPLGLRHTQISAFPDIPAPVLHAYTADRGPYEDSTFWSPSWTIGKSTIMTGTIADLVRSARAIGTGALISREAARERIAPVTIGFAGFSEDLYFGLGILVSNTWQFQNPQLNGYTAISAYLPSRKLSVGLAVTRRAAAANTDTNYSEFLFSDIAAYLAPDYPVTLPG
jgi:D-alanyl-D-alanine carboxypeptidase